MVSEATVGVAVHIECSVTFTALKVESVVKTCYTSCLEVSAKALRIDSKYPLFKIFLSSLSVLFSTKALLNGDLRH